MWPLTFLLLQTNENMELTSALQSENHIKKEIARKMGQLQEDLHNAKEQVCVHLEPRLIIKRMMLELVILYCPFTITVHMQPTLHNNWNVIKSPLKESRADYIIPTSYNLKYD